MRKIFSNKQSFKSLIFKYHTHEDDCHRELKWWRKSQRINPESDLYDVVIFYVIKTIVSLLGKKVSTNIK